MQTSTRLSRLNSLGYERYELESTVYAMSTGADLDGLRDESAQLPPDPYSRGEGRYRRFGQGVLFPWSNEFYWMPGSTSKYQDGATTSADYRQGMYNPRFAGQVRQMPGLTARLRDNRLLAELIHFDFAQTAWGESERSWPILVGVHLIRLFVDEPGGRAVATPNVLHQDGEPYTFAHLIHRRDAEGGENVVAAPECAGHRPDDVPGDRILSRFVLRRPLDSYGVRDAMVSHYVAPVTVAEGAPSAERTVLLIDFTPTTQRR